MWDLLIGSKVMKKILFLVILISLVYFDGYAQMGIVKFTIESGDCPSLSLSDIKWKVERPQKGDWKDSDGGGNVPSFNILTGQFNPTTKVIQLNLAPFGQKGLLQHMDEFILTFEIKSEASCGAGAKALVRAYAANSTLVTSDGNLVPNTISMVFKVPTLPPTITIPSGAFLCAGSGTSVDLTIGNVTDYSAYSLKIVKGATDVTTKFAVGAIGATTTIGANAGTAAGDYTVQLMKGGEKKAELVVTVKASPTITITPSQMDSDKGFICSGGLDKEKSIKLTASGASEYTYVWSGEMTGSGPILSNVKTAGEYIVKATQTGECPAEKSIKVETKAAPITPIIKPIASADADVCKNDGGTTTLTLDPPALSGIQYTWTGGASAPNVKHASLTAGKNEFTVTAKDDFCTSLTSLMVELTAHDLTVTLNPSGTISVASGTKQTVTATPVFTPTGASVTKWVWTGDGNGIFEEIAEVITTNGITKLSKYKVEITDNFGCKAKSLETSFKVAAGTSWEVKLAAIQKCGDGIELIPTFAGDGAPAKPVTYQWSSNKSDLIFSDPTGPKPKVTLGSMKLPLLRLIRMVL